MPIPTQPWLRAELIAAPETTPGAQLMIPADGIEFHDDQLVFHHQGDVVYVAPQGQLRSITWFARQPHPETARRKAQWPNHGTRWTDEERTELHRHLRAGHSWKTISHAHGRSRTGCQQEAVKQGWLDGETLTPTASLLGSEGAEADIAGAPGDPTPSLVLASAADSSVSTDLAAPAADSPPTITHAVAPADPPPSAVRGSASAGSPPSTGLATASAAGSSPNPAPAGVSATSPASAGPAGAAADSLPYLAAAPPKITLSDGLPSPARADAATGSLSKIVLAASPADPLPSPALAGASADLPASAETATAGADPAAVLPNFAVAGSADPVAYPVVCPELAQAAVAIAREASVDTDTELQPDRPRIPYQRSDSADTPDPEKDSPPGPGSRFLSRAQSSLARATLGAYMNPPRAT